MRVSNPASPPLGIPAVVWAIAGGAVALRLIHAWLMVGDPLYDHPVIDSLESLELGKLPRRNQLARSTCRVLEAAALRLLPRGTPRAVRQRFVVRADQPDPARRL